MDYYNYNEQNHTPQQIEQVNAEPVDPPEFRQPPIKKKKPKKFFKKFMAVVLVALIGTSSGFLGSYLHDELGGGEFSFTVSSPDTSTPETTMPTQPQQDTVSQLSVASLVEITQPSVVEISTEIVQQSFFSQSVVGQGAGSGVIISEDGYIVTNYHVIEDATSVTVKTISGEQYEAKLVGSDKETDLAVLKVEADGMYAATVGSSSDLSIGDYVMAIGNPLGEFGGTVSDGIVSALSRELTIEGETMTLLQTNAAINPGNSGGGLFNEHGELIGIVNAKSAGVEIEGIGFAIPIDIATEVIEDLIDVGYVQGRFTLGVGLIEVLDEQTAEMYRLNSLGVYVQSMTEGGNAHLAGIQVGDRFVEFNGVEIESYDDLKAEIEKLEAGQTVDVVVERNGENVLISMDLHEASSTNVQQARN